MLDDPARAVAEARRVLAPGGRAVLLGSDWDTIAIDSDEPETTRRLVRAKADSFPSLRGRPEAPSPPLRHGPGRTLPAPNLIPDELRQALEVIKSTSCPAPS